MEGFFEPEEIQIVRGDEQKYKEKFTNKSLTCEDCGLYLKCESPKMPMWGLGRKKLMIIGEAPGKAEDRLGRPFVGDSGKLINTEFRLAGIIPQRDVWMTNSVRCRPQRNKTPNYTQIQACNKYLQNDLAVEPYVIVTVGMPAFEAVIGHKLSARTRGKGIMVWAGECIPDQDMKTWVCPVFHPSYLLHQGAKPKDRIYQIWSEQFQDAIRIARERVTLNDYQIEADRAIKIATKPGQIIGILAKLIAKSTPLAFDYETTGLKPYRAGHEIICVSVSDGKRSYGFPFLRDNEEFMRLWRIFCTDEKIPKIAHNSAFEMEWTKVICGFPVNGIVDDSMLKAHSYNNLKPTSLKWLTYTHYGIVGYDDEVDVYIDADEKEKSLHKSNAVNRLRQISIRDLLTYCAYDSLFTSWLARDIKLTEHQQEGYQLLLAGAQVFSRSTERGLVLDSDSIVREKTEVDKKIVEIEESIRKSPDMKKWSGGREPMNPASSKDVAQLLYMDLKLPPVLTEKGNWSVDAKALETINTQLTRDILDYRKWGKVKSTYLVSLLRESVNSIIHPSINLGTVRSFRSSSSNPNLQNIPKRNKEIKHIVRSCIYPPKGKMMVGYDYKSIEVCVAALYTRDANLLKYVKDTNTDMHRDSARKHFMLSEDEEVPRSWRQFEKSEFVFAQFYGDWYGQIGPKMWDIMQREHRDILKHLKSRGIRNVDDFVAHTRAVEDWLWKKMFPDYSAWKDDTVAFYEKYGYIDSKTGFRYYGPLKKNQICNYPIQGSAFHILLWTYLSLDAAINLTLKETSLAGEIHDQTLGVTIPDEEESCDYLVEFYGTQEVKNYWDWIDIPLIIEKEKTGVNEPWSAMKEDKLLGDM